MNLIFFNRKQRDKNMIFTFKRNRYIDPIAFSLLFIVFANSLTSPRQLYEASFSNEKGSRETLVPPTQKAQQH